MASRVSSPVRNMDLEQGWEHTHVNASKILSIPEEGPAPAELLIAGAQKTTAHRVGQGTFTDGFAVSSTFVSSQSAINT